MSSWLTGQKANYRSQGLSFWFSGAVQGGDREAMKSPLFLGSFHFLETRLEERDQVF